MFPVQSVTYVPSLYPCIRSPRLLSVSVGQHDGTEVKLNSVLMRPSMLEEGCAMRLRWVCRISALVLGLTLAAPHPASASEDRR